VGRWSDPYGKQNCSVTTDPGHSESYGHLPLFANSEIVQYSLAVKLANIGFILFQRDHM
jgi:hypothetical protein